MIVWFTGRSGAGKTTLAHALRDALARDGWKTKLLDADCRLPGLYDGQEDYKEFLSAADRKAELCALARTLVGLACGLSDGGYIAVCATCSSYRENRAKVRRLAGDRTFIEVQVDCDLAALEQRDAHGYYALGPSDEEKMRLAHYEPSDSAECVVDTAKEPVSLSLTKVMEVVGKCLTSFSPS